MDEPSTQAPRGLFCVQQNLCSDSALGGKDFGDFYKCFPQICTEEVSFLLASASPSNSGRATLPRRGGGDPAPTRLREATEGKLSRTSSFGSCIVSLTLQRTSFMGKTGRHIWGDYHSWQKERYLSARWRAEWVTLGILLFSAVCLKGKSQVP